MADRKENELTKANNFDYVRALDSNGNSIQISKSDLVSVLEGLLPIVSETKNGFIRKGNLSTYIVDNANLLRANVSSDNILVFTKQCICVLIFFSHSNRIAQKIVGNLDISVYYDNENHYIYIQGIQTDSEVSLFYTSQKVNKEIKIAQADVSSLIKLL